MKKLTVYLLSFSIALFAFSACDKEFDTGNGANFETESFDNFLWKKQPPVKIEAKIDVDFAECEGIVQPLVLQLCNDEGSPITPETAQLFVGGEKSEDNTIIINPHNGNDNIDIEIVLNDKQIADTKTFTWNLQVVKNPGLVQINDRPAGKDPWIQETTVNWRNKHIANPLKVGTDISLTTILAIIVAWILLVQLILTTKFKSTQIKKIFVMVDGGRKNIQGYSQSVEGAKEIILTPTDKKQGFVARLFTGKVVYVKIKGLPGEITLLPGSGRYQTKSTQDRKKFEVETSGDNNELKVVKATEGDYAVEYYAKSK